MRRRTRYGLLFGVLAAAMIGNATGDQPWLLKLLAGSVGLCSATLSVAYLANQPGLVGKRWDGSLNPVLLVLTWPYWLANGALLLLWDRLYPQDPCDEVTPGVWLGRFPLGKGGLPPGGGAIVDLTCELPASRRPGTSYLALPALDATPPAAQDLERGCAFIDEKRAQHPVLVHCALGHGRSATLVAAYLVHSGLAATPSEAIARIQGVRPAANPNADQRAALEGWAASRRLSGDQAGT